MLAGVTLITHGLETAPGRPAWLDTMKDAIVARAGAQTAVYVLKVEPAGNNAPQVTQFELVSGVGPTTATSPGADAVVLLDWSASAGFSPLTGTIAVASVVAPYFTRVDVDQGLPLPLATLPIHLIGHSRGASLVAGLAKNLGQSGIWVDNLTLIDPVPAAFIDAPVDVPTNVAFASNYFQNSLPPSGTATNGAHNIDLTGIVTNHIQMTAYYHGTIDTNAGTDGQGLPISSNWYNHTNTGPRQSVGFAWSRPEGGAPRPVDGVGPVGGGIAPRGSVSTSGTQWPNVTDVGLASQGNTVRAGEIVDYTVRFADKDSPGLLVVRFDPDLNPFNGNEVDVVPTQTALSNQAVPNQLALAGLMTQPGTFNVLASVSDEGRTRVVYGNAPVTVTPPATLDGQGTLRLFGTEANDDIRVALDGNLLTVSFNGAVQTVAASSVLAIEIDALGGNDTIIASNLSIGVTIQGGAGDDSVVGSNAGDLLRGGPGDDTLFGNFGPDSLYGDDGFDALGGGKGFDLINGGPQGDTSVGGLGNDTLQGGKGLDELDGGDGNDELVGGLGNDTLIGNLGDDLLLARDGFADLVRGGPHLLLDRAQVDDALDVVQGVEQLLA